MLNKFLLISFFVLIVSKQKTASPLLEPGQYIGMEYMGAKDITPNDPTDRWYHENTIIVKANSIFFESVPVVYYKNRPKAYSSSDGGFYNYTGTLIRQGDQIIAKLLLKNTDYVIQTYIIPPGMKSLANLHISVDEKIKRGIYRVDSSAYKKQWVLTKAANGSFTMNGVTYSKAAKR